MRDVLLSRKETVYIKKNASMYLDSDEEGMTELVIEAIIKVGSLKLACKRQTTVTNFFKTSNASVLFVCF